MAKKSADFKIGFIGVGKMGSILMEGMVESGLTSPSCVFAFDTVAVHREKVTKCGVGWVKDIGEIGKTCDLIFVCVKPNQFPKVANELRQSLKQKSCVVSIMAGVPVKKILNELGGDCTCIRVMPNVAARVREGVTAIVRGKGVSSKKYNFVLDFFEKMGGAVEVAEGKMNAVTALSGSGPAYVMMLIESLVDGGILVGLDRQTAMKLAVRTVVGAGRLVEAGGVEPSVIRAEVSSPGGTTIEAIALLERRKFRGAVVDAVAAACGKAEKLAGN